MADDLTLVIGVDDRDLIKAQKEQKKFERNLILIEEAFRRGDITAGRYTAELNKQAKGLSRLGGTYRTANSEIRTFSSQLRTSSDQALAQAKAFAVAGKSTNKFGMYAQQVGYQVGDFFVQIQSGTSALVAFGQQGTQLAGLLPGVTGAIVGISLAVGTTLLRTFQQASGEAKTLEEAITSVTTALGDFNSAIDDISSFAAESTLSNIDMYMKSISESAMTINQGLVFKGLDETLGKLEITAGLWERLGDDLLNLFDLSTLTMSREQYVANSQVRTNERDLEQLGLGDNISLDVYNGFVEGVRTAVNSQDIEGAIGLIATMLSDIDPANLTKGGKEFYQALIDSSKALEALGNAEEKLLETQEALFDNLVKENKERSAISGLQGKALIVAQQELELQELHNQLLSIGIDAQTESYRNAINIKKETQAITLAEYDKNKALKEQDRLIKSMSNSEVNEAENVRLNEQRLKREQQAQIRSDKEAAAQREVNVLDGIRIFRKALYDMNRQASEDLKRQYDQSFKDTTFLLKIRFQAEDDYMSSMSLTPAPQQITQDNQDDRESTEDNILNIRQRIALEQQLLGLYGTERSIQSELISLQQNSKAAIDETTLAQLRLELQTEATNKSRQALNQNIRDLRQQISLEEQLLGLFDSERQIKSQLILLEQQHGSAVTDNILSQTESALKRIEAIKASQRALEEEKRIVEDLTAYIEDSFSNAFISVIDGTMSAKDAFKSMAAEIIKELYRILVVQQIVNAAKMAFGIPFADGGTVSIASSPSTGNTPYADGGVIDKTSRYTVDNPASYANTYAKGGAFEGGSEVQAFAKGGVVSRPTTFPMTGGQTGLMGEAGPEAIMPLKRGSNGKMGVQVEDNSRSLKSVVGQIQKDMITSLASTEDNISRSIRNLKMGLLDDPQLDDIVTNLTVNLNMDPIEDQDVNLKARPVEDQIVNLIGDLKTDPVEDKIVNLLGKIQTNPIDDQMVNLQANPVDDQIVNLLGKLQVNPVDDQKANLKLESVEDQIVKLLGKLQSDPAEDQIVNLIGDLKTDPVEDQIVKLLGSLQVNPVEDQIVKLLGDLQTNPVEEKVVNLRGDVQTNPIPTQSVNVQANPIQAQPVSLQADPVEDQLVNLKFSSIEYQVANLINDLKLDSLEDKDVNLKVNSIEDQVVNLRGDIQTNPLQDQNVNVQANPIGEQSVSLQADPVEDQMVNLKVSSIEYQVANLMKDFKLGSLEDKEVNLKVGSLEDQVVNLRGDIQANPPGDQSVNLQPNPVGEQSVSLKADPIEDQTVNLKIDYVKYQIDKIKSDLKISSLEDQTVNLKVDSIEDQIVSIKGEIEASPASDQSVNLQANPVEDQMVNLQANPIQNQMVNLQANPIEDEVVNLNGSVQVNPIPTQSVNLQANPMDDILGGIKNDPMKKLRHFASGGIVDEPTSFPMSNNESGLMGESGPEAILPLQRGVDGNLGVRSETPRNGDKINVVQNFNFQSNGDDTIKKLIAQSAPKMAELAKASIINDRRRGGVLKATFG